MKIYHYAQQVYPVLKTRRKSGMDLPKDVDLSDSYLDHISFFFDPIPSKLLPSIFDKGHQFWFKGNTIYEHVVEVKDLSPDIKFHAVETPTESRLFEEFSKQVNWTGDDPVLLDQWFKLAEQKQREWGELGVGRGKLSRLIAQYLGRTAHYYRAAKKSPDFEEGSAKYAANVPHLMLYPPTGEIKVSAVNRLVVGDDRRFPESPKWLVW